MTHNSSELPPISKIDHNSLYERYLASGNSNSNFNLNVPNPHIDSSADNIESKGARRKRSVSIADSITLKPDVMLRPDTCGRLRPGTSSIIRPGARSEPKVSHHQEPTISRIDTSTSSGDFKNSSDSVSSGANRPSSHVVSISHV